MTILALTMGEPAGIGGDIALCAWTRRKANAMPPFVMIDDSGRLRNVARRLGLDIPIRDVATPAEAEAAFATALPVLHQPLAVMVEPGKPDPANVPMVKAAIERAVALALAGEVAGLVTNPIHKHVMYQGGFPYPGHTEFLAALLDRPGLREVMMLACPQLRVVPVTIHLGLAEAIRSLSTELIVEIGRVTAKALKEDFAIARPRLAVAGLNPHAGEGGAMGREDEEVVAPAIARLRALNIDALGPLPSDTLFHARARQSYDAALCMYHDQALIPIKTIDFDGGVNVTLGLPIVRTSPDHGTAFDLAGTGQAKPDSLVAALHMAATIAANRERQHG
ncbi:4-hydroxythreonine-4-phosphate dehydrogenase [Paramagnetospirillum magnetotacticum MS-1]|uniref:4-hydroxythreonine-4-phosphate dehydrogenase n=1 Tax=Paramagnetospirillum magnetotacticum MS-1 TaxID=272627 RepID=A0A0C2YR11_PARME|nr:4-hydroxythreonine-4-phosphate dehydrogenase PdxA [Paramagnetospirillum magnetotacticum]KIL97115.1 4-hydroxythreonine-4-phosphate dehydrogenase [Paramagnetospirillum magnetotacticum MS-1]